MQVRVPLSGPQPEKVCWALNLKANHQSTGSPPLLRSGAGGSADAGAAVKMSNVRPNSDRNQLHAGRSVHEPGAGGKPTRITELPSGPPHLPYEPVRLCC